MANANEIDVNDDSLQDSEPTDTAQGDPSTHPGYIRAGENIADALGVKLGSNQGGFKGVPLPSSFSAMPKGIFSAPQKGHGLPPRTRISKASDQSKYAEFWGHFNTLTEVDMYLTWAGTVKESAKLYNALQAYNKATGRKLRTRTVPGAFDPEKNTTAITVYRTDDE